MTEAELKRIEDEYVDPSMPEWRQIEADRDALVAEVRRLRGLVKSAETNGKNERSEDFNCPWCRYEIGAWKKVHAPECPAFHEDGTVR